MQKLFVVLLALCAFVGGPILAADKAPADKAPAEKRETRPPFNGKIAAVDAAAKTFKVGERTFHVTDATKIVAGSKTATLADAKVGDLVGGQYRQVDGKLEVLSLRIGPKPDDKK